MMKQMINIKNRLAALFYLTVLVGFVACDVDPVEVSRGALPDGEILESTYVMIRSVKSTIGRSIADLTEGTGTTTDKIYCRTTKPVGAAMNIVAAPDASLIEAFNTANETNFDALPAANVQIANNGAMTIATGGQSSDRLEITFKADGLPAGEYLLPVVISSGSVTFTEENRVLYYLVRVRGLDLGEFELDTEYLNVFYVNTSIHQPLLADIWALELIDFSTFSIVWKRTYGNIVNLRIVQIGQDKTTGRAMLVLNPDIRYVLEHADKYIRPLQDKGRKVCLSLEGDGSGFGFCNITDEQIADFTAQVKSCIELYNLDGVHFFDKNIGYGQEEMPATNTTSYPKLIKAMRETLSNSLLVTLADYEEPTEYFWDTEATGGIEVGKYVDYAWSGYMSEGEDIQLLDPWEIIDPNYQEALNWGLTYPTTNHIRKPIAGLLREQYGHFAIPFYSNEDLYRYNDVGFMNIGAWSYVGWAPNNIVVWADLISNEQNKYEGAWSAAPGYFWYVFPEGSMDGTYWYNMSLTKFYPYYGYLRKDW